MKKIKYLLLLLLVPFIVFGDVPGDNSLNLKPYIGYRYINQSTNWFSTPYKSHCLISELYYESIIRLVDWGVTFSHYGFFFDLNFNSRKTPSPRFGYDRDFYFNSLHFESFFDVYTDYDLVNMTFGYEYKGVSGFIVIEALDVEHIMVNGGSTISYGWFQKHPQPIRGLKSTYRIRTNNMVFGTSVKHELFKNINVFGRIIYNPVYCARGVGYWNLRKLAFDMEFNALRRRGIKVGIDYVFKGFLSIGAYYEQNYMKGTGALTRWQEDGKRRAQDLIRDGWPINLNYSSESVGINLALHVTAPGSD